MRINWGIKITVLYLGFVALIITLVSMAARQNVDLVSKDYYEQELKFQQKLDKINRSKALSEALTWELKNKTLLLKIPKQFREKKVEGSIYFFRPSDASLDMNIALVPDTSSVIPVRINQLKKGLYKMQINWQSDKVEYYNEGIIQIN
ncbi:MAG TPA: FixH family protein [Bacteroidia bacterium]|jgi:hypothetical protein|nr:FixH family protein [Bacteroidia bacterium]